MADEWFAKKNSNKITYLLAGAWPLEFQLDIIVVCYPGISFGEHIQAWRQITLKIGKIL